MTNQTAMPIRTEAEQKKYDSLLQGALKNANINTQMETTQEAQKQETIPETVIAEILAAPKLNTQELILESASEGIFSGDLKAFENAQRIAKALASSDIVPKAYRGNVPNTMVAMEMANRMHCSVFIIMQNLDVINGKPSFGSKFLIAQINSLRTFSPLRYKVEGIGDNMSCYAFAMDLSTKEVVSGPKVTMAMAKAEGWSTKDGSKWKSMPELMIQYRAATFFVRLYAPEITMGLPTSDEITDIEPVSGDDKKAALRGKSKIDMP